MGMKVGGNSVRPPIISVYTSHLPISKFSFSNFLKYISISSQFSYKLDSIELMKPFNLINKHATAFVAVKSIKISRI